MRDRRISYLYAVLAVALATVVRALMDPLVQERSLFVTYFAAIGFAAWHGGFRVGLFAAVLSYLTADYFFISPRFSESIRK
jgi:K+-sensing histidine kinase KdpD